GQVERAVAVFTTGIRLAPGSADLYLDRARGYAAVGDFAKALKDLDDTVILQPDWIEAFVFRASARRQTGDLKGARTDIDKAIAETPGNVDALLERGLIFRQEGNDRAARSDWLSVLRIDARSPAAEIARRNIELMDVKAD
ncbi:MAG: tetratricopeptide repeat protein, partial [Alphaproteobacteria bacterium]|nr:tetratricopeptide repeat protein [Alphaproteobacteria bacterium]